jgi:cytochrome c oxidase assembly protein subunit 15
LENCNIRNRFAGNRITPVDEAPVLARWLLAVAALVFAMVVVGGITRLTGSGLSITEWKPVTGALPPISEASWLGEFGKYQQSPQYKQVTGPAGMTLADFKFIYFWEWAHRLLGRLIGVAYAIPLAWFWLRKKIPAGFKPRLVILLALGGMQGVAGWWMVASGLVDRPEVSHCRLAVHLLLALAILGGLVWTALDMQLRARHPGVTARLTGFGALVLVVLSVEILLGAFMAGLKAGQVAPTWPLMHGNFLPPGIDWSLDLFRDPSRHTLLVHFLHRWWAWVVVVALVILARKVRRTHRLASIALHSAFGTQIMLGIATVVTGVDITLAVLHQACAALVVAATVWCLHLAGRSMAHGFNDPA